MALLWNDSLIPLKDAIVRRAAEISSVDNFQPCDSNKWKVHQTDHSNGSFWRSINFQALLNHLASQTVEIEVPLCVPRGCNVACWFNSLNCGAYISVRYLPRTALLKFAKFMDDKLHQGGQYYAMLGFPGAGKSHILVAYAFYRMAFRFWNERPRVPRVIYIPTCRDTHWKMPELIRNAIALAFHDRWADVEKIHTLNEATHFIQVLTNEVVLFIFDDWNFFQESEVPAIVETRNELLNLCSGNPTVFGISTHADITKSMSSAPHICVERTPGLQFILEGLDETEWHTWKVTSPFVKIVKSFESGPEPANDKEARFKEMTGLVPSLLQEALSEFVDVSTNEAVDSDAVVAKLTATSGGISTAIEKHYKGLQPQRIQEYLKLMKCAVGGLPVKELDPSLYDARLFRRFYHRAAEHLYLLPTCGIVRVKLVEHLHDVVGTKITQFFDTTWACKALNNHALRNPFVHGLAFKENALAHLSSYIFQAAGLNWNMFPSMAVHRYDFNFPYIGDVPPLQSRCVHFCPKRWTLRTFDSVVRFSRTVVVDVEVEELAPATAAAVVVAAGDIVVGGGAGKKRKANASAQSSTPKTTKQVERTVVTLVFVKAAMNDPTACARSLTAFNVNQEASVGTAKIDCDRYLFYNERQGEVDVEICFLWVLPSTAENKELPPYADPTVRQVLHQLPMEW